MADAHANFAYSTVATAPSPATSGTSLVVASGQGALFPTPPFNATVWPTGAQPLSTNAEIVRVTNISTDTLTITRTQEGTSARTIVVGDQIAASITAKTFTDIEQDYVNTYTPFVIASGGTGLQTLASNYTNSSSQGTLVLFPFKVTSPIVFNQVLVPQSLSFVTSATAQTISNSFYSHFGIFSFKDNSVMSLISSNSFSIGQTLNSVNLTWNYPTSTATSGYAYGSFPAGNLTATAQISSYVSGSRVVGLQFGGNMTLSGNDYWLGIMSYRSTAVASTYGLSHAGIIGQIMNPMNMPSSISGPIPIGIAAAEWAQKNTHVSGWFGAHMVGIMNNASYPNYLGTHIPDNISLIQINSPAAVGSILPAMTFVST
jgi:hypothetical protein